MVVDYLSSQPNRAGYQVSTKQGSGPNALAENVNGSYKNELIHTRLWTDVVDVEIATFEWVNWWNESR
ncbi:integrase core domain-containing protein, partial [Corynebacterium striatum]